MLYKFLLLSDEIDNFVREIEIDSEATFLSFQNAILESVGYSKGELTAFFICSDNWEKEQEITLFEMDTDSSVDSYLMADTKLEELVSSEGQRLLFVFDNLTERAFFIEMKAIIPGKTLVNPVCTLSQGKAPEQTIDLDKFMAEIQTSTNFDTDFYGSDDYNEDELDEESFGGLSVNEIEEL
ncbi:MAG: hypothetical protein LBS16_05030 [Prevotellaceae bacterium]|jgi:hypothetical protein|nr:hypothetical protein [Prevotellaceae bacterium]